MKTSGDRFLHDKLQELGGKGLFVKELEEALLDQRADLAVHSMKDLPAQLPQKLSITTICTREIALDALVSTQYPELDALPLGAHIGTSSLRRQAQLLLYRPDLRISPLRGNVGTRLNKLDTGHFDAIILAAAGLERLDLAHRISQILPATVMLPACGQGAIGIECRTQDETTQHLLQPLHDPLSALCVQTERAVNAALQGSCHTPIGIHCQIEPRSSRLHLQAIVASADGQQAIRNQQQGHFTEGEALAQRCAMELLNAGARELIQRHPGHA
jgi:hydroxymethylbilane synthase